VGEGTLFENAIFNQLRPYGDLSYLAKGSEVDFILRRAAGADVETIAMEVKTHPVQADAQKLRRLARANGLPDAKIIGRFPTPGMNDFVWGGLIS
jgi:predicted AAA+ superfamily ATPase